MLIAGGLTIRCIIIFFQLIGEDLTWKEALSKMRKRIIGAAIAITAAGLVTYFNHFYS